MSVWLCKAVVLHLWLWNRLLQLCLWHAWDILVTGQIYLSTHPICQTDFKVSRITIFSWLIAALFANMAPSGPSVAYSRVSDLADFLSVAILVWIDKSDGWMNGKRSVAGWPYMYGGHVCGHEDWGTIKLLYFTTKHFTNGSQMVHWNLICRFHYPFTVFILVFC